jgi:arylsulfatase A-like enzyme
VLDALEKHGFATNTIVVFTSDNGAVLTREALAAGHRSNGVLLGQKTDAWEGGHRVPFLARWPGRIPAGSVRNSMFTQVDIMATLAEAAGVPMPGDASPDGGSEWAAFLDPASATSKRTEAVFLGTGGHALRQDDWLFLPKQGSGGMTVQVPAGAPWGQPYAKLGLANSDMDEKGAIKPGAPAVQLYDLRADVGQSRNLAADEPARADAMRVRLEALTDRKKAVIKSIK